MDYMFPRKSFMILLVCSAFLSACGTNSFSTPSQVPSLQNTPTIQTTSTATIKKFTLLPTWTPSMTPSATMTVATWTPLPTLSTALMEVELYKWLQGSPECRLPCFGGIIPGQTTWEEAKQTLAPLGEIVGLRENADCISGPCNSLEWHPGGFYRHNSMQLHGFFSSGEDGPVNNIHLEGDPTSPLLRLDQILAIYGAPAKAFIEAGPSIGDSPFGQSTFFDITLAYPNYHFIAYLMWDGAFHAGEYEGCIQQGGVDLLIDLGIQEWQDETINIEVHYPDGIPPGLFIPLEKATGLTMEEFYNIFKVISGDECLTVPDQFHP